MTDILISMIFSEDISTLYHNESRSFLRHDAAELASPRTTKFLGWDTAFGDFDNDGWKDIIVAKQL